MKNIPATEVSSIDLFQEARDKRTIDHAEAEKTKLGTLRGGSSGCMVGEDVIGTCHRKALVRFLGYDSHIDDDSRSIFDQGFGNESIWESHMKDTGYAIRCEEEIPIVWHTAKGTKVTCRPDLVLGKEEGDEFIPEIMLELKTVAAANSATGLWYENKPKTDNLIQCAHYSMRLGVPGILVYTWNGKCDIPFWAKKRFHIDPSIRHITPFKREFRLGWEDGRLHYFCSKGLRHDTDITQDGIVEYYELIEDMADKKDIYTRFKNKDFNGKPGPFSMCDYCPWQEACDTGEHDYDLWLDYIKRDAK